MTISNLPNPPTDSETELAIILEGIGEGFYAVDRDWRVRRFNSEAARQFWPRAGEGARAQPLGAVSRGA